MLGAGDSPHTVLYQWFSRGFLLVSVFICERRHILAQIHGCEASEIRLGHSLNSLRVEKTREYSMLYEQIDLAAKRS